MLKSPRFWMIAAAAACLVCIPASADIKTFNEKMTAQDFKGAAAEAEATWPTLDKSRDDIAIIANEFGFASYLAGDLAAARTFAQFVVDSRATGLEADQLRVTSMVLLRLAEYAEAPTANARNNLYSAVRFSTDVPGIDMTTYLGLEAVLAYDLKTSSWAAAVDSARLAATTTERGGRDFMVRSRRFRLLAEVADFMLSNKKPNYDNLDALVDVVRNEVNAAPTEAEAEEMTEIYWDVFAWRDALRLHLEALNITRSKHEQKDEETSPAERDTRLLGKVSDHGLFSTNTRVREIMLSRSRDTGLYPSQAFKNGMQGVVVLKVDVDKNGKVPNPRVLAAAPEKYFGESLVSKHRRFQVSPGETWGPTRTLQRTGHVITVNFPIQQFETAQLY